MHLDCQACGASLELEASARTATCPYCASPSVIERPPSADRPSPTFALGFTVTRESAVARVRAWLGSRSSFTRSGFASAAIEALRGIYVPAYLYSAHARSTYQARIGENYTVTETYTTTDSKGRTVVRTRQVTKTEWRSLEGPHAAYVSDVLVTASRGIGNLELEALEPFDLRRMRRYDPAILAGWYAEDPTRGLAECTELARGEAVSAVGARLGAFMPGDSHSDLKYRTWIEEESSDLVLVPVWVMAIRYDPKEPPVRVLVNGQSGKLLGKAPLSWIKIALAVGLVLGLVGAVVAAILVIGALAQ